MKSIIVYKIKDENGKEYGLFRNSDDVEEFRMYLFMEYGLNSISWAIRY